MKLVNWWKTRLWWVRWLLCLVTLIACFYGVEDLRGYLALERAKKEYLATGLRLDLEAIRGPQIPDEENFAASDYALKEHADPNNQVFRDVEFPEHPWDTGPVEYQGFRGKEWGYTNPKTKEKICRDCQESLKSISAQLRRYLEAVRRPSCDWRVLTDLTDPDSPIPHLGSVNDLREILSLYSALPQPEPELPISKFEMTIGNLAFTKHLKTNSNLIYQLLGIETGEISLGSIAEAIFHRKLTFEELDAIENSLIPLKPNFNRAFIEFEIAAWITQYEHHKEVRRFYIEQRKVGYGSRPIVRIPKAPFAFNFGSISSSLDQIIVSIIPRGWIWQSQALRIRTALGTASSEPNSVYTLLWFTRDDKLPLILVLEENFQISIQLALLAIEVEKHRLTFGILPAENEFNTGSPKFQYAVEENGQPILWYSESAPVGSAPTGKALESYEEKHLWRYPPLEE